MKKSKLSKLLYDIQKTDSSVEESSSFMVMSISNKLAQNQFGGVRNDQCSNSGCNGDTNHQCTNSSCGDDGHNFGCTNEQ